MKVQLETITSQSHRSFSMMFNPRLSDLFYWHFHPEYELVYIQTSKGTRHVGAHISTFQQSDLVLIGSNIPHLNFDYGVQTAYQKVVVHFKKQFIETHFTDIPELSRIQRLFELSKYGVAFGGTNKEKIGAKLFQLEKLSAYEQYIQIVELLQAISYLETVELLHEQPYNNQYSNREQERLHTIYNFVDKHYHRKIELEEIAQISNMSKEAFCRYFKKMTTYTFIEFLNRYRVSQSKRYLMSNKSVSDAGYHSGFESLSYYNRVFKRITGENPSVFRKKYQRL